jgi:hypothetical protein
MNLQTDFFGFSYEVKKSSERGIFDCDSEAKRSEVKRFEAL